jgi:hypothetical protein
LVEICMRCKWKERISPAFPRCARDYTGTKPLRALNPVVQSYRFIMPPEGFSKLNFFEVAMRVPRFLRLHPTSADVFCNDTCSIVHVLPGIPMEMFL